MEILILHPGGLGDVILSLPAVSLLRKRFPSAKLTIAGNVDHLAVVGKHHAERAIPLSFLPLHHLYAFGELPEDEVRFWKSYDLIISWTGSGDAEFARKLKQANPHARVASWRPGPGERRHVSRLFVDSLGIEFPADAGLPPIDIAPDSTARDHGAQWLARHGWDGRAHLIALHPGAGSRSKRWPIPRFVELARRLNSIHDSKMLIIEGPAEIGLAAAIARALPPNRTIIAESAPLSLLASLIRQCRAFAGNDSGIAHLAAGLGVPTVALFGPTLPQHWAPLGGHVAVLREPRGCSACASDQGEHTCVNNISVDEALGKMVAALQRRSE